MGCGKKLKAAESLVPNPPPDSLPPHLVFKLNLNGVGKENPGMVGYGRVCRNSDGVILQILYGSIGFDTNNSAEFEGLL